MDMWTNQKMSPFMAVTTHWIQATIIQTSSGPEPKLILRADLIGFIRVPGNHTGEHLAHAFIHVTDRIKITPKVYRHL